MAFWPTAVLVYSYTQYTVGLCVIRLSVNLKFHCHMLRIFSYSGICALQRNLFSKVEPPFMIQGVAHRMNIKYREETQHFF